ncbi:MAG: OmpA family protein [Ignavibacteriae bacterium]|nr:OmpA family protein [Ignavibacteriota bacterium]
MTYSKLILTVFLVLIINSANSKPANDSLLNCKIRLPIEINSYQPALVPVITLNGDRLYFDRKSHPSNNNGVKDFDDIWYSDWLTSDQWTEAKNLVELNTPESDVIFRISPDGRKGLIYGIYSDDKISKKQGFSFSEYDGKNWQKPVSIKIKDFYNDSLNYYATMSADEKVLIIAVSRKDAIGGLDLYVSFYDETKGEYSIPQNMGSEINTKYDDEAPFLAYDDRTLYFSSNGLKGEGEQDLFITKRLDDSWKSWSKPINLGNIINTKYSEQGICLTSMGDSAIIVSYDSLSKRKGLYRICLPKEFQPEPYIILTGNISIDNQYDIIGEARIVVNGITSQNLKLGTKKNYTLVFPEKKLYSIQVNFEGYNAITYELDLRKYNQTQIIKQDFIFHKQEIKTEKIIIYFDTDSYLLSIESKMKIKQFISHDINNKKIEINGHADESGSSEYNYKLSLNRAEQTRDFLIFNGLKKENIEISGKGENEPVSLNKSENRRVEIIIK